MKLLAFDSSIHPPLCISVHSLFKCVCLLFIIYDFFFSRSWQLDMEIDFAGGINGDLVGPGFAFSRRIVLGFEYKNGRARYFLCHPPLIFYAFSLQV